MPSSAELGDEPAGVRDDFHRNWGTDDLDYLSRYDGLLGRYFRHPDRNQEHFFFGLLRECVERGIVSEAMLREEMERNHVRHDAFEVMEKAPPLAAATAS